MLAIFPPLLFLAALTGAPLTAQDTVEAPAPPPPEYANPRATMFTFLRAVNAVSGGDEGALDSATAAMDLAGAEIDPRSASGRRAARDLWSALNHLREVQASELPAQLAEGDVEWIYFPRPFNDADEQILARVNVGNRGIVFSRAPDDRWLFSAETIRGIGELSAILAELPRQVEVDEEALDEPAWVRSLLPLSLRTESFLGLRPWQWLGLLAIIFIGLLVDFALRVVLRPPVLRIVAKVRGDADHRVLSETLRSVGLFGAAVVWSILVQGLFLPYPIDDVALAATGVFVVLAGTWAGWKLTDLVGDVAMHRAERTESKFDDIIVPLLRKTAKVFILALGIVYGAQSLNINIVPLLTGLGIGGLAFGFAAKDTIENLFGSVAVVLDRPFEVGDWVVIGDVEGTVEELGFRSTRIRTFYNSQVTVPNSALVRGVVDNYGRRQYRRWKTYIGVQYNTPPEKVLAFTEGIRELVRQHPYTRKDYYQVWANDFADSSLNILLYVFHDVPDWSTELRERERLFIDIVRLADHLGVQFAFPTRTVHLYQEQHAPPTPAYDVPGTSTDADAMTLGVRAAQDLTRDQAWKTTRPGAVTFDSPSGDVTDPGTGGDS